MSSQVDHFNARSQVRRLTSSTIPLLESSSSSEILELSNNNHRDHVDDDNGMAAASYETWGDGNLLSETFMELYSVSNTTTDCAESTIRRRLPHLPEWLLTRAENLGYIHPTMMQRLALDVLLPRMEISTSISYNNNNDETMENGEVIEEVEQEVEAHDVILHAQTGSGKTLAYLLPTLCDIDPSRQVLQAVIIVPTRELGLQVVKIARRLAGGGAGSISGEMSAQIDDDDDEEEDYDVYDDDNEGEHIAPSSSLENDMTENASTTLTPTLTTAAEMAPTVRRKKIIIMPILQGSTNARVRGWAKSEPPHIMVGTPEELCALLSRFVRRDNDDFVKSVSTVVVDEVDACLSSWRGGGGGAGSGGSQGGALHEVLSKYLSPNCVDHRDGGDDIDDADFYNGRRRRRRSRRESTGTQSQQEQFQQHLRRRRTIFASATIPQHNHFAKSCVRNGWTLQEPTIVTVGAGPGGTVGVVPPTLEHVYVVCKDVNSKLGGLRRWMKKELLLEKEKKEGDIFSNQSNIAKRVLIFCNDSKPKQLEELARALSEDWNGVMWKEGSSSTNGSIDGMGMSENNYDSVISILRLSDTPGARAAAMAGFRGPYVNSVGIGRGKSVASVSEDESVGHDDDGQLVNGRRVGGVGGVDDGKLRILLSTDLAARGLDVPDVTHVVNFDLPDSGGRGGEWYDAYVHRGGRAGRLGRKGKVMTLITPEEEFVMGRLANRLSLDLKCVARQVDSRRKS